MTKGKPNLVVGGDGEHESLTSKVVPLKTC